MNVENTQSQMRKGILEYCILALIEEGDVYASDIITSLKEAKLIVVEGTLYPLLTRLKNAGLLSYEWKESDQGPPRKYYSLTAKGEDFKNELMKTWNELNASVKRITQTKK
jgi:PadR family transcriptional regulator PadR